MTLPIVEPFKTLDAVFGVEAPPPAVIESASLPAVVVDPTNFPSVDDLASDYQAARKAMISLLEKGESVVDNMLLIATQTESARSFEVAGNLIKTMSEVAKDLVGLHKATHDAKKKNDPTGPQIVKNTQNNVVFKGSTSDLFDMMDAK